MGAISQFARNRRRIQHRIVARGPRPGASQRNKTLALTVDKPVAAMLKRDRGDSIEGEQSSAHDGTSDERRLVIDSITMEAMQNEVTDLLPASLMTICRALARTDSILLLYGNESPKKNGVNGVVGMFRALRMESSEGSSKQVDRRKQELQHALRKLGSRVGSCSEMMHTWDDLEQVLSSVFVLPGEPPTDADVKLPAPQRTASQHSEKAGFAKYLAMLQRSAPKSQAYGKWKKISSTLVPKRMKLQLEPDGSVAVEPELVPLEEGKETALETMDRQLLEQIAEAEKLVRIKDSRIESDIVAREEREEREREEAEAEAKARASTLLRPLTREEQNIVNEAIRGIGPESEILRTCENDSIQRQSLHKLNPGVWLNDEVIHYFLLMLAKRDERLSQENPGGRKRSHFFKSFFMTKLLDDGSSGNYKYANVKRWSKNVPGKDIFALSKIFFPVNIMNQHWTCAAIFMEDKRIQFFDSMHGTGIRYLKGLFQYLKDEHQAKKGCPLPDQDQWQLVCCTNDTPVQNNGNDCGVFTCMFADFLSTDCPLSFSQKHIHQCRERIALSIMNGSAII